MSSNPYSNGSPYVLSKQEQAEERGYVPEAPERARLSPQQRAEFEASPAGQAVSRSIEAARAATQRGWDDWKARYPGGPIR